MWFRKKAADVGAKVSPLGEQLNFSTAEAYNLLRTNLEFSLADKKTGRVIAITSSAAQEGKSYTSINLAYALAKNGERVLLIDADLRRPSLASTLGFSRTPGLSTLLCDGEGVPYRVGVLHENLTVIPSGDIPPNPQELVGSLRMKQLIRELSRQYDTIIIDCPPVNLVADSLTIGDVVDGYLLVVRDAVTGRREIAEAVKRLKFAGVRILGFVYNAVGAHKDGKYYKKNYYKRYYSAWQVTEVATEVPNPLIKGEKG